MEEMNSRFGILHEALTTKLDLIAENLAAGLDRIASHEEQLTVLKDDVGFLKASRK